RFFAQLNPFAVAKKRLGLDIQYKDRPIKLIITPAKKSFLDISNGFNFMGLTFLKVIQYPILIAIKDNKLPNQAGS
ncbi:MAG: hypothetical protein AAFO82_17135, partial [Bacteroidota bacterium]